MPDVSVPAPPPLVRIPRVELVHTGTWPISTGVWTATREDLQAAVAALDCPAIHRAGIKIGHVDSRFTDPTQDGEPLLGYIDNLAGEDDWNTLVGDYAGVPAWLGAVDADGNSVISSAYPQRSIEGIHDFRCQIGHTHPFVLTAVALLGATHPGVGTLQSLTDLMALYGVAASAGPTNGTPVRAAVDTRRIAASADSAKTKAMVALVPSDADIARLTVAGGLPADELHLTLLFLGDATDWDADQQQSVIEAAETLRGSGVVDGDAFAISVFNAGTDDKDTCIVLGVGGEPVEAVHAAITEAVADAPEQHQPWAAHISLLYTDDLTQVAALVDRTGPVVFDRLRVAFAGDITDIPLTANTQATAGPGERSTMSNPSPTKVAAGVTTEDVRRQYYDDAPGWDYWITEFHLDPLQLIVCDDRSGKHYRVPVNLTGEDTFTFGEPAEVLVRYVDAQNDATVAATAADKRLVYASRAESRPGKRPAAANEPVEVQPVQPVQPEGEPVTVTEPTTPEVPDAAPADVPAAEPDAPTIQEDDMSLSAIRARLGLGDDADEAAVLAALDAKLPTGPSDSTAPDNPPAVTAPEPVAAAKPTLPDGVVAIDATTLAELRRGAELGIKAAERQRISDRDRVIEAAREDGRISPARVEHWVKAWEADPDGTQETLASLAPGLVVPVVLAGTTGTGEETADLDGFSDGAADAWAAQLGIDAKELTRG